VVFVHDSLQDALMGTWSVTLYGNDAAADIRGDLKDVLRAPLDEAGILAALTKAHPGLSDKTDEEYCDLWLAVADQLHAHGVAAPAVLATATTIIDTGLDLDMKRSLGMDDRSLARRAKLLNELRARWARPHPKPLKRRIQSKPDAFVFEAGDCVAYPVSKSGATINPYFAKAEDDRQWAHDGFGAMAVLTRGHQHGVFAWYAVARLSLRSASLPALDECAAAMIEAESSLVEDRMGEKPRLAVFASRLSPLFAKKMRCEVAGRLAPHAAAIRQDFEVFFWPAFVPGVCLASELSGCIGTRRPSTVPLARYATLRGA
jgi:hypothetical protein